VGELTAVRGTLGFLGRQFQVTRGIVSFYGDPETDPALDLTLEARISGATYRVSITGDAARPKLTLSSDPQMSDGDIVASILFGKPLDQLDSGQESLLQARMLAVLAQYGADSVSGDVTRALGVDMISYDEAGDRSGRSALTIGKYLNPRTLVKYEQIIDREIAYLLRLEYALTQAIKVETAFGQGTASGVDLLWSRDY
jgi:translocation and assembly module TamB